MKLIYPLDEAYAIFAGISGFNLDRVKDLTERLGLPCYIEEAAWKYARDKSAFKKKCREFGIPVVDEYIVPDPPGAKELAAIEYPVVDYWGRILAFLFLGRWCDQAYLQRLCFQTARIPVFPVSDRCFCRYRIP